MYHIIIIYFSEYFYAVYITFFKFLKIKKNFFLFKADRTNLNSI